MKSPSPLLQELRYRVSVTVIRLIRHLPYRFVLYLFRFLSLIAYLVDAFHRQVASIQLHHALGIGNTRRLVTKVFMHQGDILVDTVRYAYLSDEEIRKKIIVEGREHLDEAICSGRGIMMITGHIGNWEILSHLPRVLGIQFCVMADKRKEPKIEAIVDEIRARSGATILPPTGKALMLIRELRKGRTIGMVIDGRGRLEDRLFCQVLGLPAPTNPAPAFIAIKGNALVLPVYAVKQDKAYHVCFSKIVDAAYFAQRDDAIQRLSDSMQSWVASVVQRYPDQWFWLYSRWLTRSDIRGVIRDGLNFREYVLKQRGSGI